MSTQAINITYTSPSSFSQSLTPSQRMSVLNSANTSYYRIATVQQDCIILSYYTASVVIPWQGTGSLWAAGYTANPALTYAPVIIQQPSSSQTVTHPTAVYFSISASAETAISYQWYYNSASNATSWYPIVSTGSYTGSQTPALTSSTTNVSFQNTSSYLCVASNTTGNTSSSIASLFVL